MNFFILILCAVFCRSEHVPDITDRLDRMEREMKNEIEGLRSEMPSLVTKKEIEGLRSEMTSLVTKKEIEELRSEMTSLVTKKEIEELRSEMASLVTKNEMLTKAMATLQAENLLYRHELSKHKDGIKKMEAVNDVQNKMLTNLQNRLVDNGLSQNGSIHSKRAFSQTWDVAFHANVIGNVGLNDNDMIRFGRVLTNIGGAYDGHVGLFQSPSPGTYVFFVNFLIFQHKRLEAQIVKNGNNIQSVYAGTAGTRYGPGSNMVIVQLKQGDRVWVKVHDTYHDTGEILDGPWCTFNGFLLYLDE